VNILILGVAWPPETFLERLIKGLCLAELKITVALPKRPSKAWLSHPNFSWLPTPSWNVSATLRLVRLGGMCFHAIARFPGELGHIATYNNDSGGVKELVRFWYKALPFGGRKWDVIYFPWNSTAIEYSPLFEGSYPMVVSCRGSQVNVAPSHPHRIGLTEGLKLTFKKVAAVHCVSEAIKQDALKYGLNPKKTYVIRPAVDPNFFSPAASGKSEALFRLVTVGALIWRKGYEYALLALRELLSQGIQTHFHVIGDGPERQRLLYTIQDLKLQNHVSLHGRLNSEEVRRELRKADAFLLASLSEGISNGVLEGMACGLPVVTTDCGGMREAVTDGREGFVVPVRDPQAMAQALAQLATNTEMCHRMGQAARCRVLREFDLKNQIADFITLFQAIASIN
jgi:colanic acid/amylovoran biosynthesis glycosyltransferase